MRPVSMLVTIFILWSALSARSQPGFLRGTIHNPREGAIVAFAMITVKNSHENSVGTSSDLDGKYLVRIAFPGRYTVTCSFVGFEVYRNDTVIIRPGDTTILDISLTPSVVTLQEIQVLNYAIPTVSKGLTVTSTVAGLSTVSQTPPDRPVDIRGPSPETGSSGRLTASELNDFSKWDLWQDIQAKELKQYQKLWKISPGTRYSVQVNNAAGQPVNNAAVLLQHHDGRVLWRTRTDNTGKAELWTDLFENQSVSAPEIVVTSENREYADQRPRPFQKGINGFKIPVPCNVSGETDIAFVVDATASMKDEINFLKSDLVDIIQQSNDKMPGLTINLGALFYRCYDNSYVTKRYDLSANVPAVLQFIRDQDAAEGGDEVVEYALGEALDSLKWNPQARARLLFLILDQQPLTTPWSILKMKTCIETAAAKGIRIIPVVASAETPANASSMEYLLRSAALATNGTYVFLTDHSHIGNTHAKPVTDQYDVELLNTLLKRIIYQFNLASSCDGNTLASGISDTTTFSNSPVIAHEVIDTARHVKTSTPGTVVKDFTGVSGSDTTMRQTSIDTVAGHNAPDTVRPAPVKRIEVRVYPNPTRGRITVEINGNIKELYLADFSGKLLSKFKTDGLPKLEIDLGIYSNGIYFLKFLDNGKWFSGKIVLIH